MLSVWVSSGGYVADVQIQISGGQTDGEILVLGVDELRLPDVLIPSGRELLLQADGDCHWLLVAAVPEDWVAFGADAVRKAPAGTISFRTTPSAANLRDFVRGWRLAGYAYGDRSEPRATLVLPSTVSGLDEVLAQTDATLAARDLVNTPANEKNPDWMVARARAIARAAGATIEVLNPARLRREGFGGVLAVGAAAASEPRVVVLRKPAEGPRVVLLGKGITYDSGGLAIKPWESMATMKTDMSGAAAVLQAVGLAPDGVDVTAIVGLAENSVGAASYRPGDVLRHVDGSTSEVRNTDAEGRLVLADLIGYARQRFDPEVMVDVATLTGAATLGLSREYGALFSNSQRLVRALLRAGEQSYEPLWHMPLVAGYRHALDSQVADRCHISTDETVTAGAVVAALYLQSFVGDVPWAHLDIAGPARATAAEGVRTPGGTGFAAALLGNWLREVGARRGF